MTAVTRADQIVADVAAQLPRQFPFITEIRLFGSYAHGSHTARSDMDFLILTKEPLKNRILRSEVREAIDSIAQKQRMETDVVFYTFDLYQNDQSRFSRELRKNILVFKR